MDKKEAKPGNRSRRKAASSRGTKLETKAPSKKVYGEKLKVESTAKTAVGEKLRFDKAVADPEAIEPVKGPNKRVRRTPVSKRAVTLLSDSTRHRAEQDEEDNYGVEALSRGSDLAEHMIEDGSNTVSRHLQKKRIKREYAALKAELGSGSAAGTAAAGSSAAGNGTGKAVKAGKKLRERFSGFASKHSVVLLLLGALLLIIMLVSGMMGTCSVMFNGGTDAVVDSSYTAEDKDITGVEDDYGELEMRLQTRIDNIRREYPGYDEYNIVQDQIGHNPYELASYLTVVYEDYKREDVQDVLQEILSVQYDLDIKEKVETRYRTETKTGTRQVTHTYTDPATGESYEKAEDEEYEYEVEVPYEYHILNVTLKNNSLSKLLTVKDLSEDQMARYSLLMETQGHRSELFKDNIYAAASTEVMNYNIPSELLTDERFARMVREAKKYLGLPYVWGGYSPTAGFDCSGFVSWVVNHCGNGWNYGRLTAEGLRQVCRAVPRNEAKPGDLIFFRGTYNTSGASHVGIYVGNGMMIHAGNPIQFASIETSYCQEHFWCFGRLP